MAIRTPILDYLPTVGKAPVAVFGRTSLWAFIRKSVFSREGLAVLLALLVAGAFRLTLAYRGWPYVNSDEGVWGMMVDDILWHGAHPLFLYGAHYMGALQTYLAAPAFAVLGPTSFTLHIVTTAQTLLFLLVLYIFTRQVYSPGAALCVLALLALGPAQAVFYELRAAAHAQDTLLFGALLLWLTCLRLRRPASVRARWALALGIGLVAGLGLWCTFLTLPFVLAAGLALGVEALHRIRTETASQRRSRVSQLLLSIIGFGIGAAPFIAGTIASGGAGFHEMLTASGAPGGEGAVAAPGLLGHLHSLGQQLAATLLISLPHILGSTTVCIHCPLWPAPQSTTPPAEAARAALISAPFSLIAIIFWLAAALPPGRDVWHALKHAQHQRAKPSAQEAGSTALSSWKDARWWGRTMLLIASALTVLEYAASRSSYQFADTSTRYLVGLYVCAPVVAHPLWQGCQHLWHWFRNPSHGNARSRLLAILAAMLLLALFALNIVGGVRTWQITSNRQTYGVPAGTRDMRLLQFLQTHHASYFYTSYWVCYRLIFAAQERVTCAVVKDDNAFEIGYNRVPDYVSVLAATPHPAYVFDLTTNEVQPDVPGQVADRILAGDPRFAGYTHAQVAGYLIYYYAGSP